MSAAENKAVFLSYASQDAAAARRICDALRASGVEVWFDSDGGLEHGDEWDAKIRRQIKECVLFIPVISASTQARHEGYFRIEWDLAAERARGIASGVPFILPVVIDDTREPDALVPDRFRTVQWTRLRGGEVPPDVQQRFLKLWSQRMAGQTHPPIESRPADAPRQSQRIDAARRPPARRRLVAATLTLLVVAGALFLTLRLRRRAVEPAAPVQPARSTTGDAATEAGTGAAEIARIRAKLRPDEWTRADFDAFTPTVDRLIEAHPETGDAWALRSIANSLLVIRNFDAGTRPLTIGKEAAERARRLAPDSPLGELALGLHLVAMISRGGDAHACRPHIERALAGLPTEPLTRYAELTSYWLGYQLEGTERSARAWLAAEPRASFPAWILAQYYVASRRPVDAARWAEQAAADTDITGVRALVSLFEARYYLQADLAAARATLDRLPTGQRSEHRVVASRFLLAMTERHFDQALQELARLPEAMLLDRVYHGPKALLAGMAHRAAGRADVAQAQFREAERMLRDELAHDSENQELRAVLALNLACLDRADDARRELAALEPLLRGEEASVYSGQLFALIAQTHGVLGEPGAMAQWLRRLFTEPSPLPFTPASLRLDARFADQLAAPEVQALLKEFAPLDPPPAGSESKSVAVLAFANLSDDKGNEYFSDGISEELLTVLQKIPGLHVAARTSAFSFKGRSATAQEIGEKLGVAHLVEGSVQKIGNRVKISARLCRVATGEELWSRSFPPQELTDAFAAESEIAQKIVTELRGKLTGEATPATKTEIQAQVQAAQKGGTKDAEAHRLYLQGMFVANQASAENLEKAAGYFQQAVDTDRSFALAWAALARTLAVLATTVDNTPAVLAATFERARAAADRALTLEPALAEAHLAKMEIQVGWDLDWPGAKESVRRALAEAPADAMALSDAGRLAKAFGELEKAVELGRRAVDLDPVNASLHYTLGGTYIALGRFSEAEAEERRAQELSPATLTTHRVLSLALMLDGRLDQALAEAELEPNEWGRQTALALTYWALKKPAESGKALARLIEIAGDTCAYQVAEIHAFRGEPDAAFQWLDRAQQTRDGGLLHLRVDPLFKSIRTDPRWPAFLKKIGLSDEQVK